MMGIASLHPSALDSWCDMDGFDKRMTLEVIEDALTCMGTPEDHGFAMGLCGAFYMCGVLDEGEWRELLGRIPVGGDERA